METNAINQKAVILVTDDDPNIREILRVQLQSAGYEVLTAANGAEAVQAVSQHGGIDLILLDIMMPEMSGVEACRRLRAVSSAPVLFLTAKSQDMDKAEAYASGGDDYLVKPFSTPELLMKVHSLLRRYFVYRGKPQPAQTLLEVGPLQIDMAAHTVTVEKEPVELTDTEYEILMLLVQNGGRTLGVRQIYEAIWQEKFMSSSANTVMVHVLNLRRKLQKHGAGDIIKTVWGKGYQIDA